MGGIFWVAKNSNTFLGVLEIPDIFGGCMVDAGSEPTYTEKMRVPDTRYKKLYITSVSINK